MFKRLHIKRWRQFADVDIVFHQHLTILTGANGAGKTTVLNLLSKVIGWTPEFVSSVKTSKTGKGVYNNSYELKDLKTIIDGILYPEKNFLGELTLSDGQVCSFLLPKEVASGTYDVDIKLKGLEKGVYVNSQRPNLPYKKMASISTEVLSRKQIFEKYNEFNKKYFFDTFRDHSEISATTVIKETLAGLAVFGQGNDSVAANTVTKDLLLGYEKILKCVLPPRIGFEKISVVVPEVVLCTKSGDFPLDAVSGGLASIINMTWQLYMFSEPEDSFVALIDEPENHLHPELQKSFLGNMIKAFPNVQFIVATHNPFMITSQRDSNIYVLDYNNDNKVQSKLLDHINKAGTANSILRNVLGIDSTLPGWAENILADSIKRYSESPITEDTFNRLRSELKEFGLDEFIPETIAAVAEEIRKNDQID